MKTYFIHLSLAVNRRCEFFPFTNALFIDKCKTIWISYCCFESRGFLSLGTFFYLSCPTILYIVQTANTYVHTYISWVFSLSTFYSYLILYFIPLSWYKALLLYLHYFLFSKSIQTKLFCFVWKLLIVPHYQ